MKVQFTKYAATGNDFVMIDNRNGEVSLTTEQVQKLCSRRTGIGSDGLILLHKSDSADYRMQYFNADGGEVDMCGNGTRALAHFYKAKSSLSDNAFSFQTKNGEYKAELDSDYVKIKMTELYEEGSIVIEDLMPNSSFSYYLNTGVPHCTFEVTDLDNFDVHENGKRIRYESRFSCGVNSNFFEKKGDRLSIRTYERGVEAETLSCGTGITAVALALYLNGNQREKYPFDTKGGRK